MNYRILAVLLLGACARGQILPGEANPGAFACIGESCNNPIDPIVNDAFTCRLTDVSLAETRELCRRLFVDTVGRLPTDEDYATHCDGKSLDQMIEDLFATPDYVLARQKLWGARLGYNDARTWYANTIGMDLIVGQLYKGEINIVDFVQRAAVHPAVLTSADEELTAYVERSANPRIDARALSKGPDGDAFAERAFRTLLLRSPTAEELSEFANLYRQFEIDPVGADTNPGMTGFTARRLRVQPCNCAGAKRVFCQVTVIATRDVTLPLRFPSAADCAAEAGNAFFFEDARPEELPILRTAGDLLPQRPDFYRNHAKEALDRLLGYDVVAALGPTLGDALLTALADNFAKDGSVRNLEANILRSVFYRQMQNPPAESPPVDCEGRPSPLYAGPRKRLDAEAFLNSLSTATGYKLAQCDYRLQTRQFAKQINGVPTIATAPPAGVYYFPVKNETTSEPDFTSRDLARTVGVCLDNVTQKPVLDSSAFSQMGFDFVAREACEKGDKSVPAGVTGGDDTSLASIIDYQWNRFFLEAPSAADREATLTGARGCLASAQTCPADAVGKRLCAALVKTARYMTY